MSFKIHPTIIKHLKHVYPKNIKDPLQELTFNQHQPAFLLIIKSKSATTFLATSGQG